MGFVLHSADTVSDPVVPPASHPLTLKKPTAHATDRRSLNAHQSSDLSQPKNDDIVPKWFLSHEPTPPLTLPGLRLRHSLIILDRPYDWTTAPKRDHSCHIDPVATSTYELTGGSIFSSLTVEPPV